MKKFKIIVCYLILCANIFSSERDDVKFLDELFLQKKYSIALQESDKFFQKYPKSRYKKNIQIRVGQVYYVEKRYRDAINILNDALSSYKLTSDEASDIYLYLAKSYVELGDLNAAKTSAALIENINDYEEALVDIGQVYVKRRDYANAQKSFIEAIKIKGKHYEDAVLSLALSSYNNNQFKEAITFLNSYYYRIATRENLALMNYIYGTSYYKLNDLNKALEYFVKLDTIKSKYTPSAYLNMLEIYLKQSKPSNAIKMLSNLKGNTKLYNDGLEMMANYYLVNKQNQLALEYYNKIKDKNNNVLYGMAILEYRMAQYESAIEKFKKLENTKYKSESIYYQFSIHYLEKNYDWILKNKNLIKNVKLDKSEMTVMNDLVATSAFEKSQFELAQSYYEANYKLNPNEETLYKLIVSLSKLEASTILDKYLLLYNKTYPSSSKYAKNITIVEANNFKSKKENDKAIELYKKYLTENYDEEVIELLIENMLEVKKYNEALEYLASQTSSLGNSYMKGIAYMGMGKYEDAANEFNKILDSGLESSDKLYDKSLYNSIRNDFLWEKYKDVIRNGEIYLENKDVEAYSDLVDKVGISYFRLDDMANARKYFEKLTSIPSMEDYANFQIAEIYYNEKEYSKAANAYRYVAESTSDKAYREKAMYWELSSLYLLKDLKMFVSESKIFLTDFPTSNLKDNILFMEADLYGINEKDKDSIEVYEEIFNTSKDEALKEKALLKTIELSGKLNDNEKELEWIEKLNDGNEKDYHLASYYLKTNNPEEADKRLIKLLDTEEYKGFAALKLGDNAYTREELEDAEIYYEIIGSLDQSLYKDEGLFKVASVQNKLNKPEDAISNFTKLYILYPESKFALESKILVAEIYENTKKYNDAIKQYDELLKTNSKNKNYFLEKLILLNLENNKKEKAKKYFDMLEKENKELSKKYKELFKGEDAK